MPANKYTMRISRLTVDKLGVKLYDKVSAVLAELIANAYDADAQNVTIHAPMGKYLAGKANGQVQDKGFEIKIEDDGAGMTPDEMQAFFLVIGAERRTDPRRGGVSKRFSRKVMGRKGVGKLAPFGICKVMEVISAGGNRIEEGNGKAGHRTSHIILNHADIIAVGDEPDEPYQPQVGPKDGTLSEAPGTVISLRDFDYRRVSEIDTLARQIAQRFGIQSQKWRIALRDNDGTSNDHVVGAFDVETMPNTRINFLEKGKVAGPDGADLQGIDAGFTHEEAFHLVTGWMGYSKAPYRDELMAGVRIYCRGKIAAQSTVFNQPAGFTGEHNIRSYLVGELYADWLDEGEDLIQTDRRDILWSSELAAALQEWGQQVVKRIGKLSRDPMRKATLDIFLKTGRVEERIRGVFPREGDEVIRSRAADLAKMFGKTISRREAEDEEAVANLVDMSIELAPHVTLDEMMKEAAATANAPIELLTTLLRTARVAELSSFGRIADGRLKVIERLEILKDETDIHEDSFQDLIERAPWLVNPEWAPVTANQWLSSLRKEFEAYYEQETGEQIQLSDFGDPRKRPDFVLSSQDGKAQIVEIKRPRHALKNDEMERIVAYHDLMESFLNDANNAKFREFFHGFHITLVCDKLAMSGSPKAAFNGYVERGILAHVSWRDFLLRTKVVHDAFLKEAERQRVWTDRGD